MELLIRFYRLYCICTDICTASREIALHSIPCGPYVRGMGLSRTSHLYPC